MIEILSSMVGYKGVHDDTLDLTGVHTQPYGTHGARTYFDGHYTRLGPLSEADVADVEAGIAGVAGWRAHGRVVLPQLEDRDVEASNAPILSEPVDPY